MSMPIQRLRFGVMCAGERLESAFAASVDEVLTIDGVELALVIVDEDPPARTSQREKLTKTVSLDGNVWATFQWLCRLERLPCYRPRDMSAVFAGVERISCRVAGQDECGRSFHPDDVERIRRYDLDFILRFGSGSIRGEILDAARYGL